MVKTAAINYFERLRREVGSPVPSPSAPPPQPRRRVHFNPEKSLSAKLFGIDFGNAFGKTFRRGSGVTPLRGYFKTSAGIFAAGHFRGLGESFCNHHFCGGWDARPCVPEKLVTLYVPKSATDIINNQ